MTERTIAEQAERLSRRRALMLPFLGGAYIAQQTTFLSALGMGEAGSTYGVKIAAWSVL